MENEIRIDKPAFIDPLTGLANRYYLNQFLPEEIKKAALNNYPLNLLMIDLDGFKKVNDTHGHLCGDKVLVQVADILKKSVRTTDIVIRYAGDEFIILLPGSALEKTQDICRRMLKEADNYVFVGDKEQKMHLSLSIGLAVYPEDAQDPVKLIGTADKALYLSKKRGKNTFSSAKEVTLEEVSALAAMDAFPCPKFINQKEGFEKVRQAFGIVQESGILQAVFVAGTSGAGKTRFMEEVKKTVKDKAAIISCGSSSVHMQDPYYLFAKGISSYIDSVGMDNPQVSDIFLKMPVAESSELSLIIPQIRNIVKKPLEPQADDKSRRFMLFKAFLDFLTELNNISTVAIIFDDIQWIDKASLELLRYLIQREKTRKAFIGCIYEESRPSKESSLEDVQNLIQAFSGADNVRWIKLENLSSEDTSLMIDAIFPGACSSPEFPQLIYDTTKGVPSFIEELLKSVVENGLIFYQDKSWQVKKGLSAKDIPVSLEDILKRRLKTLDEETKEMIVQAAVIGDDFQLDMLKKIGDKDEGFISEMVNRAKKMRLIDELGPEGKFNFINKRTKDILYNELNPDQRNKIHFKVAETLASQHKDSIYNVAGEVAFHYSRAPQEEKAIEFSRQILGRTKALFDPQEVSGYIQSLVQDILAKKEKSFSKLSDAGFKEALRFVVLLQGAVKKFRLYPLTSSVRVNTVKELYPFLSKIFQEVETLVISEVEKSLVINGKRPSPSEVEFTAAEHLISIMIEHNIKTISLKRGIKEPELNKFMHHLSQTRCEMINDGGWQDIINKENLESVGIDEVRFTAVDEYAAKSEEKRKLQDIMLAEFLLGKIDNSAVNKEQIIQNIEANPRGMADAITNITKIKNEEGAQDEATVVTDAIKKLNTQILGDKKSGEFDNSLARIILELDPALRNKVIRGLPNAFGAQDNKIADNVFSSIPDEMIVDIGVEEYKNNPDNPLLVKEFVSSILVAGSRKEVIMGKLKDKLAEAKASPEDIAFIAGKLKWEDIPAEKRISMLLKLPKNKYSASILEKIKFVLDELDSGSKKDELKNTITALLAKIKELDAKSAAGLSGIIFAFLKEPFSGGKKDYLQMADRINYILEGLDAETEPAIFARLLEIIQQIADDFMANLSRRDDGIVESEDPLTRRFCAFIDELYAMLFKRLKKDKEQNGQIYELSLVFAKNISQMPVLEILCFRIATGTTKNKYNMQEMREIIGDKIVDALINLVAEKKLGLKDPFSGFLARKRIAGLLNELKSVSFDKLKERISNAKEEINVPLIELAGYLKSEALAEPLLALSNHNDANIRQAVIAALGEAGGEKAAQVLLRMSQEDPDNSLRELANVKLQKIKKRAG
ncbi:MAG: diguanylate cyclase [Candidatus Omnitrophota bacterium]